MLRDRGKENREAETDLQQEAEIERSVRGCRLRRKTDTQMWLNPTPEKGKGGREQAPRSRAPHLSTAEDAPAHTYKPSSGPEQGARGAWVHAAPVVTSGGRAGAPGAGPGGAGVPGRAGWGCGGALVDNGQ